MSEHADLEKLIELAYETGRLHVGSETYKLFSSLSVTDRGCILLTSNHLIEIIESERLEPYAICAIKNPSQ